MSNGTLRVVETFPIRVGEGIRIKHPRSRAISLVTIIRPAAGKKVVTYPIRITELPDPGTNKERVSVLNDPRGRLPGGTDRGSPFRRVRADKGEYD